MRQIKPPTPSTRNCDLNSYCTHRFARAARFVKDMSLRKRKSAGASAAKKVDLESQLDDALRETFPASDPIAITIDRPPRSKVILASKVVDTRSVIRASVVRGPLMEAEQAKVGAKERSLAGPFNPMLWGPIQLFNWWSILMGGGPANSAHKETAAK
jgi:hypothetical protein